MTNVTKTQTLLTPDSKKKKKKKKKKKTGSIVSYFNHYKLEAFSLIFLAIVTTFLSKTLPEFSLTI